MGFLKKIFGSHSDHELKRLYPLADKIDALSDEYAALTTCCRRRLPRRARPRGAYSA